MIAMPIKIIVGACLLLSSISIVAQKNRPKIVSLIFDTDMGPDYDDVGAIALMHAYADSGQVRILATIASTKYEGVGGVLSVFNTYFNRATIPIAVPKGMALELKDKQHWSDTLLAKYPHQIKNNEEVPDAVALYRKVLAAQPDKSVTVVTIGFLTNLANLYQSKPDNYSALDGKTLIKKKVKLLVCMAGRFPKGREFNVQEDAPASQMVFNNWETPIIFSGFEIGLKIKTGLPLISNTAIQNSPVKDAFSISIPQDPEDRAGRCSWDETAVLVAIKGYSPWYTLQEGKMEVAADGSNTWNENGKGQFHLIESKPYSEVQSLINYLMMHQPVRKR
jgi:pyrimidine-specific ribonucleoside hydrolase